MDDDSFEYFTCPEANTCIPIEVAPIADTPTPPSPSDLASFPALDPVDTQWPMKTPRCIAAETHYGRLANHFYRGCLWSPDGLCIATNNADNHIRIYNTPSDFGPSDRTSPVSMSSELSMKECGLIYDFAWYPLMNSQDPVTCCLATAYYKGVVNLWDAYTGHLRASYIPVDHLDEMVPAYSVAFSLDGKKLFCGFNKCVRIFHVDRPGRYSERRPRIGVKPAQGGVISCFAMSTTRSGVYACGSYNRSVALFASDGECLGSVPRAHYGGVTQMKFAPLNGEILITGARKDHRLLAWDVRRFDKPLLTFSRMVQTNQRVYFDFDPSGRYLFTGNHNGTVSVFSVQDLLRSGGGGSTSATADSYDPMTQWSAHADVCNGVSVHPDFPLVATCAGQRHVPAPWLSVVEQSSNSDDSDSSSSEDASTTLTSSRAYTDKYATTAAASVCLENSLRIWAF